MESSATELLAQCVKEGVAEEREIKCSCSCNIEFRLIDPDDQYKWKKRASEPKRRKKWLELLLPGTNEAS